MQRGRLRHTGKRGVAEEIAEGLKSKANPEAVAGMARFGIRGRNALGIGIPVLRAIAKQHKRDHELALHLWRTGIHEARILASMVDDPALVTSSQMDAWADAFDSWDVCDQCCLNLFIRTSAPWRKAKAWSRRRPEFVKRAGFVMMACLAVKDRKAPDSRFLQFFHDIRREACDDRNFVRKAVNWALRQIGKRNPRLRKRAIGCAKELLRMDCPPARWIAADALRELKKLKV